MWEAKTEFVSSVLVLVWVDEWPGRRGLGGGWSRGTALLPVTAALKQALLGAHRVPSRSRAVATAHGFFGGCKTEPSALPTHWEYWETVKKAPPENFCLKAK